MTATYKKDILDKFNYLRVMIIFRYSPTRTILVSLKI